MITEEKAKAKAYDRALERAREIKRTYPQDKVCETIFPELAESEGEKIRKSIIHLVNAIYKGNEFILPEFGKDLMLKWLEKQKEPSIPDIIDIRKDIIEHFEYEIEELSSKGEEYEAEIEELSKYIAWLEKQGEEKVYSVWVGGSEINDYYLTEKEAKKLAEEYKKDGYDDVIIEKQCEQKPADKIEPKFKVGDWIVNNNSGSIYKVTKIRDDEYCLWPLDAKIMGYLRIIDVDNEYHLWTIRDAKDGDMFVNWNNTIYLFKGIEEEVVKFYCYYNTNSEEFNTPFDNNSHLGLTEPQFEHHPATKEQRDTLKKAMADAGYTFDFEKKELKKIEQKSSWSEEDERGLGDTLWCCKQAASIAKDENDMGTVWLAERWLNSLKNRLKSLRPQNM